MDGNNLSLLENIEYKHNTNKRNVKLYVKHVNGYFQIVKIYKRFKKRSVFLKGRDDIFKISLRA